MATEYDIVGEAGLKFFGKISASVSHEIKNVLAIINETEGLMEDLAELAKRGTPVDPERMKLLAQRVKHQIKRGDGIVKTMNRFAHSADEAVKNIDLKETIQLMSALCERFATMKGVTLATEGHGNPLVIRTNPFLLENLIWLCLDFAMQAVGEAKTVVLIAEATEMGARLRFGGLETLNDAPHDVFPGATEKALLEALNADLSVDIDTREVVMMLPKDRGTSR
jgi:C4-dicarboxylate-specific signal transduction histidine kinase